MHIINLSVRNFGVFKGHKHFDFSPLVGQGSPRKHLTLITGHNGAGKSTLFTALRVGLHGSLALGDRVSRKDYFDFVYSRFHSNRQNGNSNRAKDSGVSISFEYIRSGVRHRILVQRQWRRRGKSVSEELTVLQDGEPPDIDPTEFQTWLDDLVPPSHAHICFFDAEQLAQWSSLAAPEPFIASATRRLLNLHYVERLQNDLKQYTQQRGGTRKIKQRQKAVIMLQSELDHLISQRSDLEEISAQLGEEFIELQSQLRANERHAAEEGASFADLRPGLQERLSEVEAAMEETASELREQSTGLLPFTLVPQLLTRFKATLDTENQQRMKLVTHDVLRSHLSEIQSRIAAPELWADSKVRRKDRDLISKRVTEILQGKLKELAPGSYEFVHQLSDADEKRLEQWVSEATSTASDQARDLSLKLKVLKNERRSIMKDLGRAPDDEVLAPFHQRGIEIERATGDIQKRQAATDRELGANRFQIDEIERSLRRAHDELIEAQSQERELRLAHKSNLVLEVYKDLLLHERLQSLEADLVASFNTICRKGQLLASAKIDTSSFAVRLETTDGRIIGMADLSAGERHIFALSFLWSLRKLSGRNLPLVIDSPLARMDELHRERFIDEVFPSLSDQLILFVTDAEVPADLIERMEPYLARSYLLTHDEELDESQVALDRNSTEGGLLLYQVPALSQEKVLTVNADLWTSQPIATENTHELKRSLLPSDSRRLVLMDPDAQQVDWRKVEELEKLTGEPGISSRLRDGQSLRDIWTETWTFKAMQEGYDSISITGPLGHEEYVLNPAVLIPIEPPPEDGT